MRNILSLPRALGRFLTIAALAALATGAAQAAQFNLSVLIQAGDAGISDWEAGQGDNTPTSTTSISPYWANGVDRLVEMEYQKPTNTMTVRVYNDNTNLSAFDSASFNPTGGGAVSATAEWTLPAAAFFVNALGSAGRGTAMTVSNITLGGVFGAITILQPLQQTTLTASRAAGMPTSSVTQSDDVVFLADNTGSWRLSASVRLSGISGVGAATNNQLAWGLSAVASEVPEPATFGLIALGFMGMFLVRKRVA
jgi:hypothetical protein